MLTLNLLDDPMVHPIVAEALVDRLVQEEVWAQTLWPEGVPCLTPHILENLGDWRDNVLAAVRGKLARLSQ